MTKPKFTKTAEKRSGDATTYTTQPMAASYGWKNVPHPAAGHSRSTAPPVNIEPGRTSDFNQGVHDAWDKKSRTAAVMVGTYAAIYGLQHWSPWRRHEQGR